MRFLFRVSGGCRLRHRARLHPPAMAGPCTALDGPTMRELARLKRRKWPTRLRLLRLGQSCRRGGGLRMRARLGRGNAAAENARKGRPYTIEIARVSASAGSSHRHKVSMSAISTGYLAWSAGRSRRIGRNRPAGFPVRCFKAPALSRLVEDAGNWIHSVPVGSRRHRPAAAIAWCAGLKSRKINHLQRRVSETHYRGQRSG